MSESGDISRAAAFHPAARSGRQCIGEEATPVIVIDDLLQEPARLRDFALQAQAAFSDQSNKAYPGLSLPLSTGHTDALMRGFDPVIRAHYSLPGSARMTTAQGRFSLVTQPPQQLHPLQRIPHVDARDPWQFAILIYLNQGEHGGTGFYRHQPTGYERISQARFDHFLQQAKAFMQAQGMPAAEYYRAQDGHFRLLSAVDYRPNRALIYPGNLLHCGLIQPHDINADPSQGRLTINLFVQYADDEH